MPKKSSLIKQALKKGQEVTMTHLVVTVKCAETDKLSNFGN